MEEDFTAGSPDDEVGIHPKKVTAKPRKREKGYGISVHSKKDLLSPYSQAHSIVVGGGTSNFSTIKKSESKR